METKIHQLPTDLLEKNLVDNSVFVFDYHIQRSTKKGKIILNKNAFSFLLEGNKEIYYGKNYDRIDKRQFLLLSAGNCLMTETISVQNSYRSVLLFFDHQVLVKFIADNRIVIPKSNPLPYLILECDEYILSFVSTLLKANSITPLLLAKFLETKIFELLYYMVSKIGPSFLYSFMSNHSTGESHFRAVIENTSLKKLSIEELAFLNNMSLSTFKRQFNHIYNSPPGKWFLKRRLQFAAALLSQQDKRPIEIYEELGFESLSSFIQSFKAEYGTTPGQFRP